MSPETFEEAAKLYLEYLNLENGRNIPIKRQQLNQELIPFFAGMRLPQIKRMEVERFKRHLLSKGLAPSTVNRYLGVLSHLFHKALEWEWIERIPSKIIKYPEDNIRTRYLNAAEVQRLIQAAEQDPCNILAPFIRIALGTAMRRSEILAIQIRHIDCANREIFIPEAKTGARVQPMTASLAKYLTHYLTFRTCEGQIYLFPAKRSKTGHRMEIEKPFYRAVQKAGLDRFQVCRHTLRHTAITHLVQLE